MPKSTDSAAQCHLFVVMARNSPKAIILRRGPGQWVRLISWDTAHDTFDLGQWFKGRIYERRCDLSPNGNKFIYFASKINNKTLHDTEYTYAWTAISKPPYFTALVLWPKGDCWHGGGLFEDKSTVWLNHRPDHAIPHKDHRPPNGLEVIPNVNAHGEDHPIYFKRLARDGWSVIQEGFHSKFDWYVFEKSTIWQKYHLNSQYSLIMEWLGIEMGKPGGYYRLKFSLRSNDDSAVTIPIDADTWADWDQHGRIVYVRQGCLFAAQIQNNALESTLLSDFSVRLPENIAPPDWAKTWGP